MRDHGFVTVDPVLQQHHREVLSDVSGLLVQIKDVDLSRQTPCSDWNLRDLVQHMTGQNRGFATALATGDADLDAYAALPAASSPDLQRGWQESVQQLLAAAATVPADRPVRLVEVAPQAVLPAAAVIRIHLLDTAVHGWDLATSLGASYRPSAELVDLVFAVAERVEDGPARRKAGAAFAPARATIDLDDPWLAALAHLGRNPA
jgi:uncharacterized protein (TIGR03086 family)